jgi:hypothetical protein
LGGPWLHWPRVVPEYSDLMRRIGAKNVLVREDGSRGLNGVRALGIWLRILFRFLWGCALPGGFQGTSAARLAPKEGKSLASRSLPHENGSIADGLYVVQLEP